MKKIGNMDVIKSKLIDNQLARMNNGILCSPDITLGIGRSGNDRIFYIYVTKEGKPGSDIAHFLNSVFSLYIDVVIKRISRVKMQIK